MTEKPAKVEKKNHEIHLSLEHFIFDFSLHLNETNI